MPGDPKDNGDAHEGLDYVKQVRENTRRYVEEMRLENERLSLLVSSLESERLLLENRLIAIQSELDLQISERAKLLERIEEVEGERQHWARDAADIEEQNNNLANLYVATYGLHGTLNRGEVIDVIKEIIANLIGSEEMAVFELDSERKSLELLASQGVDPARYRSLPEGPGVIWQAVHEGTCYIAGHCDWDVAPLDHESSLTACIPLKLDGRVTGAITLFRLLGHKHGLQPLDFELFDLLGSQAGVALHCTRLRNPAPSPPDAVLE